MRVALVHDYIKEYGGAERVLEVLHEIYPQAPIYTLLFLPEFLGPHRERVEKWDIRPIIPSWTPFLPKITSLIRLIAPFLFARLDLSEYDLVIVSATGAYNPNLVKVKSQKSKVKTTTQKLKVNELSNHIPYTLHHTPIHICYCHTPPRYLYGLPTAREWTKHWWIRIPAQVANHFLRLVDFRSAQKVDFFIANSKNTASRIWKFYRQKAKVIYPPVEDGSKYYVVSIKNKNTKYRLQDTSYYLAGGRLARSKRIDLAVKACTELGLPLKVFGRMFAGYGEELKGMVGPMVEFLGEVADWELANLYANCRAFIFPAEEEDFGIAPVEVMAHGKPVIALRSGGVVESIIEGKTGLFFDEPTVKSLVKAIKRLGDLVIKPEDCARQAEKFSKERFIKEMRELMKNYTNRGRSIPKNRDTS